MKIFTKTLMLFLGITLITTACRQTTQTNEETTDTDLIEKSEIEEGLKDLINPLPEPFEVYAMLDDIGASYLGDVLNSVENSDKYFSQKSKAENVGVFAADLSYAATYNKQDDVKKYSKTLKSLLDDLGVKLDYSVLLDEESKQLLDDKDSLVVFVSDVYYDTYSFLYKESAPELSALMAAGAWAEGLYIATHISNDTYQNTDIVKIIYDQGESLGELVKFLEKFQDDERVAILYKTFKKLKTLYDETEGNLSKEQLEVITKRIEEIRDTIIS